MDSVFPVSLISMMLLILLEKCTAYRSRCSSVIRSSWPYRLSMTMWLCNDKKSPSNTTLMFKGLRAMSFSLRACSIPESGNACAFLLFSSFSVLYSEYFKTLVEDATVSSAYLCPPRITML